MSMASLLLGATLGPAPATIAEISLDFEESEPQSWVLVETQRWEGKSLAGAAEQQDPITTQLTPKVKRDAGVETIQLSGYHLSEHEQPGDTRVTGVLLLTVSGDSVSGFWYEDHQEVPTMLWSVTGTWERSGKGGALKLSLAPVDGGPTGSATGLMRQD